MDAPNRGALMFVRFTAACLMVVGLLDTGLYLAKCLRPKPNWPALMSNDPPPFSHDIYFVPEDVLPIVLNSIPLLIGIAILIKAKAIAQWLSEKLE
jgi:hypothetical protein